MHLISYFYPIFVKSINKLSPRYWLYGTRIKVIKAGRTPQSDAHPGRTPKYPEYLNFI